MPQQDQAFIPKAPIRYRVPDDFPTEGRGTISVWLKADDWTTSERKDLLDGQQLGQTEIQGTLDAVGDVLYIGVPNNGGQPWRGAMDEFRIEARESN
jgi:hypothetical protein